MKKKILLLLFFIFQISLFHYIFALAESPKNYLKGKFYSSVKDHFLIATEKMKDDRFFEQIKERQYYRKPSEKRQERLKKRRLVIKRLTQAAEDERSMGGSRRLF